MEDSERLEERQKVRAIRDLIALTLVALTLIGFTVWFVIYSYRQ